MQRSPYGRWLAYFDGRSGRELDAPVEAPFADRPGRRAVARSIERFELGESGDGANLRRLAAQMSGCVLLLALLPLLGCGDDRGRSRAPEEMAEDKQEPQATVREATARGGREQEVRTPEATARCVNGIAAVSAAQARKGPFVEGDKEAGLEAAVVTDVATVFFFESSTKAKQSASLMRRGGGVHRVVGRAVIQYASEPETGLDDDLQRCLTDPAPP